MTMPEDSKKADPVVILTPLVAAAIVSSFIFSAGKIPYHSPATTVAELRVEHQELMRQSQYQAYFALYGSLFIGASTLCAHWIRKRPKL